MFLELATHCDPQGVSAMTQSEDALQAAEFYLTIDGNQVCESHNTHLRDLYLPAYATKLGSIACVLKIQKANPKTLKELSLPALRGLSALLAIAASLVVALLASPSLAQSVQAAEASVSVDGTASTNTASTPDDKKIRPFHINVPEENLVDLRNRIAATRWPDQETVSDRSQGAQLATMKELARYWQNDYDWRKAEAKLNALPEYVTTIDGVDIQFVWVRSSHPNAMPLIMTHGWPGSIFELTKVIGPLTDPPAYGGRAEDSFDLVLPSMPGYGFSGRPQGTGWNPDHIARAWDELMRRLGYTHYVAQGERQYLAWRDALLNQPVNALS
jgi:hypothetical protein